jgi:cell division protein ZapA (FtsZ GTPase activity inhibitor)
MREIAEKTTTIDPARIAIMAAMSLAEELSRSEKQPAEGERVEVREKIEALTAELQEALES